ncbi:hypothetical protein D3C72_1278420 [compost metagenome]
MQTHVGAGFGRAVQLLEVDADGAVEAEQVGADGGAGRVGDAHARQSQHVFQGAVDEQFAQLVADAVSQRHGLAVQNLRAAALGHVHEMAEHVALDAARVFHAYHHAGEHVLEHARWRKVAGGADFAHVDHHRVARFGAVDGKAGHHGLRQREQAVADPRHGQVGQDVFIVGELVEGDAAFAGCQQCRVALAHALRFARGARGVQDHGRVAALARCHGGVEKARVFTVIGPAQRLQGGKGRQLRLAVMAHAAFIVIGDVGDVRIQGLEFEQLVDLLLVFDDGVADFRILQHVGHVGGRCVLVQWHGHAAQALRGQHGPVQAGTVVADDGQVHAALEADGGKAAGQRAHFLVHLGPGPGLPDAQVFFAKCGLVGPYCPVLQ